MSDDGRTESAREGVVRHAQEALREAREAVASAERALGGLEVKGAERGPETVREAVEPTWRERLWTAPAECRIGVRELTEGLGISESWIYSRTKEKAEPRLPHAKIGGALVFKCGEVRAWIRDHETVEVAYRMDSAPGEFRVDRRAS